MRVSKKIVAILALLAIVCVFAFASDAEVESPKKDTGWSINAGTAYLTSHIGASYNMGRWEFGANLYSGFPNIAILSYLNTGDSADGDKPSIGECVKLSLKLAYAGSIFAMYDLTKGDKLDIDVGLAVSGLYSDISSLLELDSNLNLAFISLDLVSRVRFNFNEHHGIYFTSELPVGGLFLASSDEDKAVAPFAVLTPEFLPAALTLMMYTTKIGYVYSF